MNDRVGYYVIYELETFIYVIENTSVEVICSILYAAILWSLFA